MKRSHLFIRLFLLTVLVLLPAISPAEDEPLQISSPPSNAVLTESDRHRLEQQTFFLINQYRKASQLPPLQWDGNIAREARDHSRDMATGAVDFGHDGFRKRVADLKTVLVGLNGAGENVFKCDDPNQVAQFAVDVWLKSPPHLKNIRGDYNYSGMGIWAEKDGMIYFTQIFVKLKPPVQQAQAAPQGLTTPLGLLEPPSTR